MTNDDLGLGAADADARWIGVRRHQAVVVVAGLVLAGDGVVRAGAPVGEVVVGVALAALAIPAGDGLTVAGLITVVAGFVTRSRWGALRVDAGDGMVNVVARGRASVAVYALEHRGRLDLNGRDLDLVDGLRGFVDALAVAGGDGHVSLHVRTSERGSTTALCTTSRAPPPPAWSRDDSLVGVILGAGASPEVVFERWGHVRTRLGPAVVLRVRDFTGAPSGRSCLARVLLGSDRVSVAVHSRVVDAPRALRLAERAVHRHRSDGATTAAAGFRRTARVDRAIDRVRERESLVAAGRALVRLAVFVAVRAESATELASEVALVRRLAHESGLRVERGRGRQAAWYSQQLPGGPGW
ncbi:MAG: hypothetical protein ACRDV0_01485 [Acidimicrobiales bacterium]